MDQVAAMMLVAAERRRADFSERRVAQLEAEVRVWRERCLTGGEADLWRRAARWYADRYEVWAHIALSLDREGAERLFAERVGMPVSGSACRGEG